MEEHEIIRAAEAGLSVGRECFCVLVCDDGGRNHGHRINRKLSDLSTWLDGVDTVRRSNVGSRSYKISFPQRLSRPTLILHHAAGLRPSSTSMRSVTKPRLDLQRLKGQEEDIR